MTSKPCAGTSVRPQPSVLLITCPDAGLLAERLTGDHPENLPTYPCVREKLDLGTLRLHGWFFKSATGELFAYHPAAGQFELLTTFAAGRRA
jgi:carbonic anhydrase